MKALYLSIVSACCLMSPLDASAARHYRQGLWVGTVPGMPVSSMVFKVRANNLEKLRLGGLDVSCFDLETEDLYHLTVTLGTSETSDYLIEPDGRISGAAVVPDGAYRDTEVRLEGRLSGGRGRIIVGLYFRNLAQECATSMHFRLRKAVVE